FLKHKIEDAFFGGASSPDREPTRFAAGCLARRLRAFAERLGLPTRCGWGPSGPGAVSGAPLRVALAPKLIQTEWRVVCFILWFTRSTPGAGSAGCPRNSADR